MGFFDAKNSGKSTEKRQKTVFFTWKDFPARGKQKILLKIIDFLRFLQYIIQCANILFAASIFYVQKRDQVLCRSRIAPAVKNPLRRAPDSDLAGRCARAWEK
ncbi:MAG: hypothetical protein IJC55_02825 [Clostridia bacterium]|nr:hypothetical protein [Clostridia bacterium]